MKTKSKISACILRGGTVALLFWCVIVALCSAINLPEQPPKALPPQGNATFGPDGQQSAGSVPASARGNNRSLSFADRVAYQRAIEKVYWRHRIWPATNADSKPPLDKVMSQTQIEKKVEDYLRDSQALEDYWQRPITPDQLQAEMERMAQHTRQPQVLRELFQALADDPFVIAECLARPVLAQRSLMELNNEDRGNPTTVAWRTEPLQLKVARAGTMAAATANYTLPTISSHLPDVCTDDAWTPTSLTNAPIHRRSHTAVWTGSEMIVWGGYDGDDLNTGGIYNPSTDSWTATNTTNAPTARYNHTAVWTGSEMIIWGGFNDSLGGLNTGGKYNPSTNSWTATSATNAPDVRRGNTTVWTGSEMIVWGGEYFNTGGRYNPGTDSWTTTSTTNAPEGRDFHSAVWTGTEMIVWGGFRSGIGSLNTGGKYNPSTDSWTATSTTNAPIARRLQTAVWTGSEMIVWGGYDGNQVNTGGRYNPATDSWATTSTTNAPDNREAHTAVWAGSEMIVWGGFYTDPFLFYLNTGGRYNLAHRHAPSNHGIRRRPVSRSDRAREKLW